MAQTDPDAVEAADFWFHLLEDKAAAFLLSANSGFLPPTISCCVTEASELSTTCSAALSGPIVIKAVDGHSNTGVFVFDSGISNASNSTELLTNQPMMLDDVVSALEALNPSKILVEEYVATSGGDLPSEYKFHMFNGVVGAVDVIMNRGTGCDCYAVMDMDGNRLDQQGCFETVDGMAETDGDGCIAVNTGLGFHRAGLVKQSLSICSDVNVDLCALAEMAEVATAVSSQIGVYIRVDMFLDASDEPRLQEYSTNHMGGYRYCASTVDPVTGCLDPCYLGQMWDENGSNKLYGGDQPTVPSYLADWSTLTAQEQCDRVMATSVPGSFTSSITQCTMSPTGSPVAAQTPAPTTSPTSSPTGIPTKSPTAVPTASPTVYECLDIIGTVYHDGDCSGIQEGDESNSTFATVYQSMFVTAYGSDGGMLATSPVSPDGTYRLADVFTRSSIRPPDEGVRIEFGGIPSWLFPTDKGLDVQFYTAPDCDGNANLGLVNPNDDCCQSYPPLALPCYVNGDQTSGEGTLVRFSSNSSNPGGNYIGYDNTTGSTWGTVFIRSVDTVLSAAFVKRHTDFGPAGVDGIYIVEDASGSGQATTWLNVASIGINVGTVDRSDLFGVGVDDPSHDDAAFDAVAKLGIGDIEYDEARDTLWLTNLADRALYGIMDIAKHIKLGTVPDATDVVGPYVIDNGISCSGGERRPWALTVHNGILYAGLVCSGETTTSNTASVLTGHILNMDPENPGNGWTNVVSSFSFDYDRKTVMFAPIRPWSPWGYCDTIPSVEYFHPGSPKSYYCESPIISGLEFDSEDNLIVLVMDRDGHQLGWDNYIPNDNSTAFMLGSSEGDILKFCKKDDGTYVMEGTDPVCVQNSVTQALNASGAPSNQDRAAEFYTGDFGPYVATGNAAHQETSQGSAVYNSVTDEIVLIAMDPADNVNSGGLIWLSPTTGENIGRAEMFNVTSPGGFAKAAGLGELELMCQEIPLQIGNRVWDDTNGNGLQDGGEPGIAGVSVTLADLGPPVATYTTTTNADGTYCFDSTNVGPGIQYFHSYEVSILVNDANLFGKAPTEAGKTTNNTLDSSNIDSDGVSDGTKVVASITTGGSAQHDSSIDFGFL